MLRNYLLIAFRTLFRHKIYSAINVLGLAVGMACCVLILLFVNDEVSYDRHHEKGDRIYRVLRETHGAGGGGEINKTTSGPLADALERDFPEVETGLWVVFRDDKWFRYGDRLIQQALCLSKPEILDVFTFPFLAGDKGKALSDPFSIVLNEDLATSLFGQGDPIGKIVTIDDLDFGGDYRVTGVVSVPKGTFGFGALISTMPQEFQGRLGNWMTVGQWRSFETYVLLAEGASTADLESKLPAFMETYMGAETRATNTYHLQQLTRTHLYSGRDYGIHGSGDIDQIYVFIALAGFILLVACVNFMNLATARSADRCREVGMRKAVGAVRWQLAGQFLAEATLLALVSFVLSLVAIKLSIPALNELTNKTLVLNPLWIPVLGLLSMGVGLLAGSYPALVLSGFRPAAVLRGKGGRDVGLSWLRGVLVTFQFAVSICVIAITLVVESQLTFIRNKDLGFDKEQIVRLDLLYEDERVPKPDGTTDLNYRYDVVKRAFVQHANVLSATVTRWPQGTTSATGSFHVDGRDEELSIQLLGIDEDYFEFFGIDMLAGRNLTRRDVEGRREGRHFYLINESATEFLGWDDPVGKELTMNFYGRLQKGPVLGMVEDFHTRSLREKIAPVVFNTRVGVFKRLYLRIRPGTFQETLPFLEETWTHFLPSRPFHFTFLDETLDREVYANEIRAGRVFGAFASLAIFIACLGLLGLISYSTQQRRKEVGIRRVLAASVGTVVMLLSREFLKLVVIANLIAWPVAYIVVDGWLQSFVYRIDVGLTPFLLAGFAALVVSAASASYITVRAAMADPIDAIRSE